MTSETVRYDAAKVGGLTRKPLAAWMGRAVTPSHKGLFTRKAQAAGMSTGAFARAKQHAPGVLGREARLAQTFAKFRPKKKPSLVDHLTRMRAGGAFRRSA